MRRLFHLVVAVGLAVAMASGPAVQNAPPAAAADCPASGGVTIPKARASGDVVFRGGGWGHGLGMSQYGAQGAANLGCSHEQILRRYYAGSEVRSAAMPDLVRLRMLAGGYRTDVRAHDGPLTWGLEGCVGPTPENPGAAACPPVQPQGATWQLRLDDATRSQYVLYDLGATPKAVVWQGGTRADGLRLQQSGTVARVTTWKGSSIYLDRWLRWDSTRFTMTGSGTIDAEQHIVPSSAGSAMDKYLWGIAEVPASFPVEALKAQAVAARTYAAKRAGRVLQPTPADQNYTGWKKETEGSSGQYGARWKSAVDATSGQVVAQVGGGLIDAFYSSSMGGYTEDERYVWGVEAPWLRAVDDSRWDVASSNPAEKRSWARAFSWAQVASKLGFQSISAISVPRRGSAARVAGVKVTGVRGGAVTTTYLEGWDVRQALGLLSPGFTISTRKVGGSAAQPLSGDWDGNGTDEPGWFRSGTVSLSTTVDGAPFTHRFDYGQKGDVAVVGDWDRDGDDDIGVFRNGTWLLRTELTAGDPTIVFDFGKAGDKPVVGSWNGRTTGIGVVRGTTWKLRRTLTAGPTQRQFRFGRSSDVPVVGSWNGKARTSVGVERDGRWLLRKGRSGGKAHLSFRFGWRRDRAVTGDWDGDGTTTVGVARRTKFTLRATLGARSATTTTVFVG